MTLHLPATTDTHHLFDDARFAKCKHGHPPDQHGARRARRRAGAAARDRKRHRRRRRPRRVRKGAADRLGACPTAAGHRDAAHRRVDRGSAGTGRASKPPSPSAISCATASCATPSTFRRCIRKNCSGCSRGSGSSTCWARWLSQMGVARIEAISLRYYGALAESHAIGPPGVERGGRRPSADPVGQRSLHRQRAHRRPAARHRRRRVAKRARPAFHEPHRRSSFRPATASAGSKARSSSRTARGWCPSEASTSKRRWPARCSSSPTTISRA